METENHNWSNVENKLMKNSQCYISFTHAYFQDSGIVEEEREKKIVDRYMDTYKKLCYLDKIA